MYTLQDLTRIVANGNVKEITACVKALLYAGVDFKTMLSQSIMPALDDVGRRFEAQQIFIPEMLLAARTVKLAYEVVRAEGGDEAVTTTGKKMVLGTVAGDLHDIGKNIVAQTVLFSGIEVIDLGVDVPAERFVQAAEQDETVAIVGVSALLTSTLPAMRRTVAALRKSPAYGRFRIMVGGAPVTAAYARKISADYYTDTAYEAATVARKIVEEAMQHG